MILIKKKTIIDRFSGISYLIVLSGVALNYEPTNGVQAKTTRSMTSIVTETYIVGPFASTLVCRSDLCSDWVPNRHVVRFNVSTTIVTDRDLGID